MPFARLAMLCAALAALPLPALGQRPMRFEEAVQLQRVGGFSLSPDGRQVAFASSTPDVEANASRSAIWIVPAGGGEAVRMTSGEKRDTDPRFAPDGRRLAFLSNRDGSSQIWTLNLAGGDAAKATSFPTEVNGFTWSPDGKWFLITSDVFPECADTACLEKTLRARAAAKVRARVAERLLFRRWDSWKDGTRTHVWKMPVLGSRRGRRPDARTTATRRPSPSAGARTGTSRRTRPSSSTRRIPTGSRRSRPTPISTRSRSAAGARRT